MDINTLISDHSISTIDGNRVKINKDASIEDTLCFVKEFYDFEIESKDEYCLDLRGLNLQTLVEVMKYSLTREDLVDKLVILNIINLIKTCNTLADEVFNYEDLYFTSLTDFLDFKLAINKELKEFSTKLSIYYVSLFKSYAKLEVNFLDDVHTLPNLYATIIASLDFFTLGGIFSKANSFNTSECMVIENAAAYVTHLVEKAKITDSLLDSILKDKKE